MRIKGKAHRLSHLAITATAAAADITNFALGSGRRFWLKEAVPDREKTK
ncbi:MAG: hypothetical protein N3B16_04410 [Candidatus Aminicenantes bacterium]|nr:hypothetical protein [Candidatus Aminicenantes bacterium]